MPVHPGVLEHVVLEADPEQLALVERGRLRGGVRVRERVEVGLPRHHQVTPDRVPTAHQVPAVEVVARVQLRSGLLVGGHPGVEVPVVAALQVHQLCTVDVHGGRGGELARGVEQHGEVRRRQRADGLRAAPAAAPAGRGTSGRIRALGRSCTAHRVLTWGPYRPPPTSCCAVLAWWTATRRSTSCCATVGSRPSDAGSREDAPQVRLDGRWVMPGLWDAHVHLTQWALARRRLDVSGATSAAHAVALVADASRRRRRRARPWSASGSATGSGPTCRRPRCSTPPSATCPSSWSRGTCTARGPRRPGCGSSASVRTPPASCARPSGSRCRRSSTTSRTTSPTRSSTTPAPPPPRAGWSGWWTWSSPTTSPSGVAGQPRAPRGCACGRASGRSSSTAWSARTCTPATRSPASCRRVRSRSSRTAP